LERLALGMWQSGRHSHNYSIILPLMVANITGYALATKRHLEDEEDDDDDGRHRGPHNSREYRPSSMSRLYLRITAPVPL
jgi:hypothetical protein